MRAQASRLRQLALRVAARSGMGTTIGRSRWRQRRLTLLCYHGLALEDEHRWRPELYITAEQLIQRCERLRSLGATVLSLEEGVRRVYDGTLPPLAVAITFDDGCVDFSSVALPILSAHGLPVTVYLTTYYAMAGVPIYSLAVDYLLWRGPKRVLDPWPEIGIAEPVPLGDQEGRLALSRRIVAHTRGAAFHLARRAALLDELAGRLGGDASHLKRRRLLSIMHPDEVADCSRRGVSVELHTHRHRAPRDPVLFQRELHDNGTIIERLTGYRPRHFCYPSGDHVQEMFGWLEAAGVRSATTCQVALAGPQHHRLALPRFLDTSLQTESAFDGWVTGAAAWLSRPIERHHDD